MQEHKSENMSCRPRSLDGNIGAFSAYINLVKTVLGSGILTSPLVALEYGYGGMFVLFLTFSVITMYTLWMYVKTADEYYTKTGDTSGTLSNISTYKLGKFSYMTDLIVVTKCFFVASSYIVLMYHVMLGECTWLTGHRVVLFCVRALLIACAGLLCFFRISLLKYTSTFGTLAIFFLIFSVLVNRIKYPHPVKMVPFKTTLTIDTIGKVVFSYTCHQNICPIYSCVRSLRAMRRVIVSALLTVFVLYVTYSYIVYSTYGEVFNTGKLVVVESETIANTIRITMACLLAVSFPLQIIPGSIHLISLLGTGAPVIKYSENICTALLCISAVCLGCLKIDISSMVSQIGTLVSTFLCYILPSMLFARTAKGLRVPRVFIVCAVFFLGATIIVSSMYKNVQDAVHSRQKTVYRDGGKAVRA